MKKSTIGMGLLVAMVLAKAYLNVSETDQESAIARSEATYDSAIESNDLRAEHNFVSTETKPSAFLLASNFGTPDVSVNRKVQSQEVLPVENGSNLNLTAQVNTPINEEEIIPLDNISNTGYGLWKSGSEEIISKTEREGKLPLDRGNTITDNMSILFPRVP